MTQYRIRLLAVPAHNDCPPLPEGYYGSREGPGSMNPAIYDRVTDRDKARVFNTPAEALNAIRNDLRGWRARCEPPITVIY